MAKEIRPLQRYNENTEQTEIFYPATTTDAIAHTTKRKSLTNVIADIETGIIYDVTANNPTAGPNNDGKWESLSALLSDVNLNTLIPTSVRRGGMSIKYVQSSDHKYVQYRLISQTFTIDVTQWQGVDKFPTPDSHNFVESSGIFGGIDNKTCMAYFSGPTYPTFRYSGTTLFIDFPEVENTKLRLYGNNGVIVEFSLSELESKSFKITSMNRLVYDFDDNTVKIVSVSLSGNFCDLLYVLGNPYTLGNVGGALSGYYYAWLRDKYNTDIVSVENKRKETDTKIFSNYFIGASNTYTSTKIDGLIGGEKYVLTINTADFDTSEITVTGVHLFNLKSYNADNVETVVLAVYVGDNIHNRYIVDIPSDSTFVIIGGRNKEGKKVHFNLDLFSNDLIAYFTDAAVPSFEHVSYNNLKVTLPNGILRFYNAKYGGIYLEKDLSEQTREFTISSLRALVYDYDRNAVEVQNVADVRHREILLSAAGNSTTNGNVDGLLRGYYLKWIINKNNTVIDNINNKIRRREGIVYFSGPTYPTFRYSGNNLIIDFPDAINGFRLYEYDGPGTVVNIPLSNFESLTFTLSNMNKLVYDFDDNTAKVVDYQAKGNYCVLLAAFGNPTNYGNVNGALMGYYLSWIRNSIKTNVDRKIATAYFTDAAVPQFNIIDQGTIKITFPPSGYVLRFYGIDGGILDEFAYEDRVEYTVSSLHRLVYNFNTRTISIQLSNVENTDDICVLFGLSGKTTNGNAYGAFYGYYVHWLNSILPEKVNLLEQNDGIGNIQKYSDLKFVFFSDIHAQVTAFQHIVNFANKHSFTVDCIINGGDTVNNYMTEGLAWYNNIVDTCNVPILNVPGNHDCWNGSGWNWANKTDVYSLITSKVKETVPTIIQPTNAETDGLCYYYKDFGTIRVICLHAMQIDTNNLYFDVAQQSWFAEVLENARTTYHYYKTTQYGVESYELQEGDTITATLTDLAKLNSINGVTTNQIYRVPMSVIAVTHAPYHEVNAEKVSEKLCSMYAFKKFIRTKNIVHDGLKVNNDAVATVNNYIQNGGSFICWLVGHTHMDSLLTHATYEGQLMIAITTANSSKQKDCYIETDSNSPYFDRFNYIGVDLAGGIIKCLRIGQSQDFAMGNRKSWAYDYVNKKLLSEN